MRSGQKNFRGGDWRLSSTCGENIAQQVHHKERDDPPPLMKTHKKKLDREAAKEVCGSIKAAAGISGKC